MTTFNFEQLFKLSLEKIYKKLDLNYNNEIEKELDAYLRSISDSSESEEEK